MLDDRIKIFADIIEMFADRIEILVARKRNWFSEKQLIGIGYWVSLLC